jgi:hypothetical protein
MLNVGFTVFFCISSGSVNEEKGFLVYAQRGREKFKAILASPARISFHVLRSFLFLLKL